MRYMGSFLPGEGVGRRGGALERRHLALPSVDFETPQPPRSPATGRPAPEDCTSQDWGSPTTELEPHFDRFEYLYGICGKGGNLKGANPAGGKSLRGRARARVPETRR